MNDGNKTIPFAASTALLQIFFLAGALFVFGGCADNNLTVAPKPDSKPDEYSTYPFSEIGKIYDVFFKDMTSDYFKKFPDLAKEHTKNMQDFIAGEEPREKFIKETVPSDYLLKFQKAAQDIRYRNTQEFSDAFEVVVGVAIKMAKMIIGNERNVYVAKFVEKDPVKLELFAMPGSEDKSWFVSWVSVELSPDLAAKEIGKEYALQNGDRVFCFRSPESTWNNFCGRQGYLIVRDGKIADIITTMLN